jgi:hypothetical protein
VKQQQQQQQQQQMQVLAQLHLSPQLPEKANQYLRSDRLSRRNTPRRTISEASQPPAHSSLMSAQQVNQWTPERSACVSSLCSLIRHL